MQSQQKTFTLSEYLELEKDSSSRNEYISGNIFEMPELGEEHNLISGNIDAYLRPHLKSKNCSAFIADMKLWIEAADVCYYPDMMVVCDPQDSERAFKTRPCLIIEIVARSTAGTDRQEKWFAYQTIPSLQEYMLISETEMKIEIYRKDNLNNWRLETLGKNSELRFESLGLKMPITEVYHYVFTADGREFLEEI
jgi:Uma2 family endonuclease